MVRRIVWTKRADEIFTNILAFYVERNDSKLYIIKLDNKRLNTSQPTKKTSFSLEQKLILKILEF